MIILGIHAGHDSSSAIIKGGEIIADVQEERFTRLKHSNNIPIKAIEYCLKSCDLNDINQVDYIGFSWKNNPNGIKSLFGLKSKTLKRKEVVKEIAKTFLGKSFGINKTKPPIYIPDYNLNNSNTLAL